jgi:hypothetical protein
MRAGLLACTLLALLPQLEAQQPTEPPPTILRVLHEMKSSNPTERERAFSKASELLASDKTTTRDLDRLRVGVIQLLIAENPISDISDEELQKQVASQPSCGNGTDNCEGDDEEDQSESGYLPRLTATVATFHDERAIPALVGAMPWGGAVTTALLGFGDKALGPVTEQLNSRNSSLRMSALDTAIAILEARNDVASQVRIRELIRSSLNDPLPHVRTHVVQQIDCRKDRQDFVPLLQEIAKTDPFILPADGPADDGGDGDKFYPVRFDARRVLRHIQNNEPCTP